VKTEVTITLTNQQTRKYYMDEVSIRYFREWLVMNGKKASENPCFLITDPAGNNTYIFRQAIATVYIPADH
jgi:hypothetical protein